jgi:hypothetical protein
MKRKTRRQTWPLTSYPITYAITHHPKGEKKPKIEGIARESAAHALLIGSVLYPPDGSLLVSFGSIDGRRADGGELEEHEWFKIWVLLARRLGKSKTLDPTRRDYAKKVFEVFMQSIGAPGGGPAPH